METTLLAEFLDNLKMDTPQTVEGLTVVPLVQPSRIDPKFILYTVALANTVKVREVSEQGVVSRLGVENPLDEPVLILSSQELVGAKQNRVVATDILVAAGATIDIPCACVEQGSWSYRSRHFTPAAYLYRNSRAKAVRFVADRLKSSKGYELDQGETWSDVAKLLSRSRLHSPTMAMRDAYTSMEPKLGAMRSGFTLPDTAVGVAVLGGGRLLGLDIFDRASTFAAVKDQLLDSYTLDWLHFAGESGADVPSGEPGSLEAMLEVMASASWEEFDPPGMGRDCRWCSEKWTASALSYGGSVLHLQAFPMVKPSQPEPAPGPSPVTSVQRPALNSTPQREGSPAGSRCPRCQFSYACVVVETGVYCNHCGYLEDQL